MNKDKIQILVVDDHEAFRVALAMVLEQEPDLDLIGEATSGEAAVHLVDKLQPDVVLMDVRMPGISGAQATRQILEKKPDAAVIGLSMHDEGDIIEDMRQAGCRAYFNKASSIEDLVQAVREVVNSWDRSSGDMVVRV